METISNEIIEEVEVNKIKRCRGRPQNPNRHLENGVYDAKPLDKNYFKNYYKNNLKTSDKIACPLCGRESSKLNLLKHQKTTICKNISALL